MYTTIDHGMHCECDCMELASTVHMDVCKFTVSTN